MSWNDRTLLAEDGTHIAYGVAGAGPALILTNGLTTSSFFWKYLRPSFLQRHTVITWDLPGHGASGPARSLKTARLQNQPRLIATIMDRLAVTRAVHLGWSTGCQLALETYRQFPGRCDGVGMLLGGASHVLDCTRLPLPGALIERIVRAAPAGVFGLIKLALGRALLMDGSVELGRKFGLIGPRATDEDMRIVIEHIVNVDAHTLQSMLLSIQEHSARTVVSTLRVPLLIVAGDKDPFAPSELVGVPLHASAPMSELLRLHEGTHTAMLEQHELIAQGVLAFATRCIRGKN
jgi:pimeloyl-ACP methyl ester carboxylesterase